MRKSFVESYVARAIGFKVANTNGQNIPFVLPYPTVEHFAKWVGDLARFCSLMPQRGTINTNDRQQSSNIQTRRVLHSKEEQPSRRECLQCKGNHEIAECEQFKELAMRIKWEQVKRFHTCFSCLRKGHGLTQCRKKKVCAINGCSRYHHPLLNQDSSDVSTVNSKAQAEQVLQCREDKCTSQLFKILPVALHGPNGTVIVYALLDEGSSVSLLQENAAKSIGLKGPNSSITLQWYGNVRRTENSMKANVEISPAMEHNRKYVIKNLHTVKDLNLPTQSFDKSNFTYLKHLPMEDYEDKKPSLLIGLDHCFLGLAEQIVEAGPNLPVDDIVLPGSFEMAKKRLVNVKNKMRRDPVYAANYKGQINQYIDKGYARILSPAEMKESDNAKLWYLPHFGVMNPHKPGKLRIVFDAAAISSGMSLNSALLKGPEHAKSLQTILFQYRQGRIAVAGDIQEMFSQVSIIGSDQNSQRFLWRDGDSERKVQTYVIQSMVFGAICSPCCAEFVKNINAKGFESTMPKGARAVINNTYVYDLVISFNSMEEALEITMEAIRINSAAGFNLRNFSYISIEVERKLNVKGNESLAMLKMKKHCQTDKILGLYWNQTTDAFEFHVKFHKICADVLKGTRPPTKREALGMVMAIFDPFGFLANFTRFSKLLIQKTWKLCLQWDDQLPQNILKQWNACWKDFEKLKQFTVPRCYSTLLAGAEEVQLHVFVDASSSAYAAVAYLRILHKDDVHVSFVMAKSRCAPAKGMTIPRLELQAAILGCRLKTLISGAHDFTNNRFIFWSDSKTVLWWIRSTERGYKQFIACRIAEILTTTEPEEWKWLPTELNVADEATRAKLSVNFGTDSRWLKGPEFLRRDEQFWLTDPPVSELNKGSEEEKVNLVLTLRLVKEPILKYEKFSKFLKLKRCAAWVLRLINVKLRNLKVMSAELAAAEVEAGEKFVCRQVQIEAFGAERSCFIKGKVLPRSSSIYQLTPYLNDKYMLLKVNGRIDNAYVLPETARNPIIMPTKHPVTLMIIAYYDERRFWVPYIRSALKSVKKSCSTCVADSAKPVSPLMGQLPIDRVTPYVPIQLCWA